MEDDGRRASRVEELTCDVDATTVGQVDVQERDVRGGVNTASFPAATRLDHDVSCAAEAPGYGSSEGRVILEKQHARLAHDVTVTHEWVLCHSQAVQPRYVSDADDRARSQVLTSLGRRIAELRRLRGYTQEQMSVRLGVATKYYQRIERGSENLTVSALTRLAEALGVPLPALFDPPTQKRAKPGRPRRGRTEPIAPGATAFIAAHSNTPGAVPLVSLEAAAGSPLPSKLVDVAAWVVPATRKRLREGMFVARVVGRSMEPTIRSGSFCLFSRPVATHASGQVLLIAHRDRIDPDTGTSYSVKRVRWRRGARSLQLSSDNLDVGDVDVDLGPPDDPHVVLVAQLVDVLGLPG